jgi:hypothetical protein
VAMDGLPPKHSNLTRVVQREKEEPDDSRTRNAGDGHEAPVDAGVRGVSRNGRIRSVERVDRGRLSKSRGGARLVDERDAPKAKPGDQLAATPGPVVRADPRANRLVLVDDRLGDAAERIVLHVVKNVDRQLPELGWYGGSPEAPADGNWLDGGTAHEVDGTTTNQGMDLPNTSALVSGRVDFRHRLRRAHRIVPGR